MSGFGVRTVLPLAISLVSAMPVPAAQPPPPKATPYAVFHPRRPTPSKAAVDRGLSLEHECLNAVSATRATPRMARPNPADWSKHDAAAVHLDQAEEAAHAGHGQDCQNELSLAEAAWR